MRAVVQRVSSARVSADGDREATIGKGLLVYLGVGKDDRPEDVVYVAEKVAHLRIFADESGGMARSVLDEQGEALVVSQFTLFGDVRRGRRPDFLAAMRPEEARALYERFVVELGDTGVTTRAGWFGAHMVVESANDGPVTILVDSRKIF